MGKKRGILSLAALVLCFSLCWLGASQVYAGESYGSHYGGGVEDFMTGAIPPPGTNILMQYIVDYNASTLNGNSGHAAVGGPLGQKANFSLNALGDAIRYVKITNCHLWGGDLLWHVILPVSYEHVSLSVNVGAGATGYGPGFPDTKVGLGDIETGVGVGWHHSPTLHSVLAFDIVAPTGQYSYSGTRFKYAVDAASLGRNYWSFDPLYAITYIGDKNSPIPGLELSSKFMYWVNTVNSATSYVSGQQFVADYLVGYHPSPKWAVGVNGFYMHQFTNDTQYGQAALDPLTGLPTGVRTNEWSIGPAFTLEIPHGCVTLKWQHDIYAQNAPLGDKFWLRWVFAF
jgi:hypothetical protein